MFPISDEHPTLRPPIMTIGILGVMFAAWFLFQGAGFDPVRLATAVCNWGMVPGEITKRAALGLSVPIGPNMGCEIDNWRENYLTPLTSMFLHGGWGHIIGNALFLWVFGNNVEDSMGHRRFVVFYLICGLAAAAAHIALDPASPVPTVGASGAISGVMGAYLVLYPRVRVNVYIPPIFILPFPAWAVLVYWFFLQVFTGLPQMLAVNRQVSGGVAVWAHVGGFVAGVALVKAFVNPTYLRRRSAPLTDQAVSVS
ncbi:MAG: rhomboid family intramembrane serine protease [Gemmatimonadaceae bacterium]|jgi:membrane associated rhomboid family serine protease|nr:rhomboid family intramembrane serine protease [Gemmatimonadaceae bacterium]